MSALAQQSSGQYAQKVTRQLEVPYTRTVKVPTGYRLDVVEDRKVVEVDELQAFDSRTHQPVGEPQLLASRDLGRVPAQHFARSIGAENFPVNHPAVRDVDEDSNIEGQARGTPSFSASRSLGLTGSNIVGLNSTTANAPILPPRSYYAPSTADQRNLNMQSTTSSMYAATIGQKQQTTPYLGDTVEDVAALPSAGGYRKTHGGEPYNLPLQEEVLRRSGLTVTETHTRHTDGTGVCVSKVERGGPAAMAGLQPHDIITAVSNRPTSTVEELCQVLARMPSPHVVLVNRDGRRNIRLTFNL